MAGGVDKGGKWSELSAGNGAGNKRQVEFRILILFNYQSAEAWCHGPWSIAQKTRTVFNSDFVGNKVM
jgi:hypothetical protein